MVEGGAYFGRNARKPTNLGRDAKGGRARSSGHGSDDVDGGDRHVIDVLAMGTGCGLGKIGSGRWVVYKL